MTLNKPIWSMTGPKGVRFDIMPGAVMFYVLFGCVVAWFQGLSIGVVLYPLMFAMAVLIHEWGHAWTALRQGLAVKRIAITFAGGHCDTEGGHVRLVFRVVLMGPMASIAMAVLSFAASVAVATWMLLNGFDPALLVDHQLLWMWLLTFAFINLAFGVLNLFPFQPLDGGKLVHLGLSLFLHPDRASVITGWLGLVLGAIWILVMAWMLLSFAFFVPVMPRLFTHFRMAFGGDAGAKVMMIKPDPEPVP